MKVGQFLKLYHVGSSSAVVVLRSYDNRTKKSESFEFSLSKVAHIDQLDLPCKAYKVESFAVSYDEIMKRPQIDLYTSYTSEV